MVNKNVTTAGRLTMQGKLPERVIVACSGGPDSCAVAGFLAAKHHVTLLYINHNDGLMSGEMAAVRGLAHRFGLDLLTYEIQEPPPRRVSRESYWSRKRLEIYRSMNDVVVTGHNLDDCIESWIFSSMNGNGYMIPYKNGNVYRPFRLTPKATMVKWCNDRDIPYFTDTTNNDPTYAKRNFIRANMSVFTEINPGISKVIRKKLMNQPLDDWNQYDSQVDGRGIDPAH